MKPIQQHEDSQIANISLDHFTGTICIITPISTNEHLMLSSPRTNPNNDIFNPNHHFTLITQPVLGSRSRKKHHIDSITSTQRTPFSYITSPINQEKKSNHYESTDSGIDLSLSTNSSSQHVTNHRPLSVLTEDLNNDDQPIQSPVINLGRNRSLESIVNNNNNNTYEQQKNRSSSFSDEREKFVKRSNDNIHLETITEVYHQINPNKNEYFQSSTQPYRLLNVLPITHTIIRKPNISTIKPLTKRTKLNIIIRPPSNTDSHDEQTQISNTSSNQTTPHLIKPKATTPLGHYPNQEQIRAHINRSVIERQHPSYLSTQIRKGLTRQKPSFDTSPSKTNHTIVSKPTNISPARQTRQTLPNIYHNNDHLHHRQEKSNQKQLSHDNHHNEHIRIKEENFLTSTPRHDNPNRQINKKSKQKQQSSPDPKLTKTLNHEFELKYSPRNPIVPLQTRPTKLTRKPCEHKSSIESINTLLQTTKIQPTNNNNNNPSNRSHNIVIEKNPNRFFQTRSPLSWSIISNHQTHEQNNIYETTSSSSSATRPELMDDKPTRNYQTIAQQPIDGRYVIPCGTSQLPLFLDSPSQTSSRHTYPFTCTLESEIDSNAIISNSPCELLVPNNSEMIFNHQSISSSSYDHFCPKDRFPLSLGKVTVAMNDDEVATNHDSDDGWSNDSAELIYIDERYAQQKKKSMDPSSSSSTSHLKSKQHENVFFQS